MGASSQGGEPTVSVIIPARNAADTIERQLEAVCAQVLDTHFEVIIVDNGSEDSTADIVRRATERFQNLRIVNGPERPNRSAARNAGALEARGAVLAFCDADDRVCDGWLRALVEAERQSQVVTGALVRIGSNSGQEEMLTSPFASRFRGVACLAAGNFAIRRQLYLELGGFSEEFTHRVDTELSCRLLVQGIRVAYQPDAVVLYMNRPTRWSQVKQHFHWAVAGVQIQHAYRSAVPFSYGWKNSIKHWLLVGPATVLALARREDVLPHALTLATLAGQLVGSIRYRFWAV